VIYGLWPEERGQPAQWADLRVGTLTISGETKRLFQTRAQLRRYLGRRSPSVDFEQRQLLLVSPGPRSSTGYSLEVEDVRDRGSSIVVTVRERTPGLGEHVEPRVTYPYRLLSLPAGKDVYVDWRGR
jgi:hypothetical protein